MESARVVTPPARAGARAGPELDPGSSIPARFEVVVQTAHERLAISGGAAPLTYAQLDVLAAGYAGALSQTAPPARIALLLGHGAPVIAAALGALRAGHTVITINPSDPPARLARIRAAAAPALVVTDSEHAELAQAAGFTGAQMILGPVAPAAAGVDVSADALAFLICTSGSTGAPKLVMQSHRNMISNARRYAKGLGIDSEDRIAWLASLSGGQGLATAWTALLSGATLCPFPIVERGFTGLAEWLESERITVFDTLPSILRSFARTLADERRIRGVRLVRLASEPAQRGDFEAYRRHFPSDSVLASVLGSSETGIVAQTLIDPTAVLADGRLPVGTVAEGIEVRMLDERGVPVANGEPGEVVVCSDYLSPGYWDDPALTAQRFERSGSEQRFRTGDLGRRGADGSLTVLGRADGQIKIRGHRLQLEEVEAALAAQPGVSAAAVAAETSARGDTRLTAYVSMRAGAQLSAATMRRALRAQLAPHAVPTAFVALETLPLTATGKIDRERLAEHAPSHGRADPGRTAASDTEALVGTVWSEAFERETVDPDEPFLELGGDSLTAAVIAATVHELFGVEFELGAFDIELTVARMAAEILQRRDHQPERPAAPAVTRLGRTEPVPLSFSQLTIWQQAPDKGAGFNAAAAFRLRGHLDVEALRGSLEQLMRRHEILRTGFVEHEGRPQAVVEPPGRLELPFEDLRAAADPEAEAAARLAADAEVPFDLRHAPLLRFRLLRLGDEEHWLTRTAHHIISDAPSWQIFLTELSVVYDARREHRPSPLSEEPPLQFRDYAQWERDRLDRSTPAYEAELEWWQARLVPTPPRLQLPSERPAGSEVAASAGGVLDVILGPAESAALDRVARAAGATYFMSRLAIFAALAALDSGTDDLALDTYTTLRRRAELLGMFGPLMNRSILRLHFDGAAGLEQWLAVVRAEVVELAAHSWVPFELMIEDLQRRGVRRPALRTKFQAFDEPPPMHFGGLELEALPRHQVAPWAFTLDVNRRPGGERWRAVFGRSHDPDGVAALLNRMRRLTECAAVDPAASLAGLHAGLWAVDDAAHSVQRAPLQRTEAGPMLAVLSSYEVSDYEQWKQAFDKDRFGRAAAGRGHSVFRSVENPNLVFVTVHFDSVVEANAFRDRMLAVRDSNQGPTAVVDPTVVELADGAEYGAPAD